MDVLTLVFDKLRIGESPSICPFLKNKIIFQEWTDTRNFSDLKYTSTKIKCIFIDTERFLFALGDKNVLCLHVVYSAVRPFPGDTGQFDNGKILQVYFKVYSNALANVTRRLIG